jgi:selenocysteine-specific elongation factor
MLRALTGIDPDRLKEEKLRQMTTDLGFAHLALRGQDSSEREMLVGFIDVPGHGKFLKNMLAGVGGIHMALLVVAADEGPMPQTVSHVKILKLLGVSKALLVVTKVDIAGEASAKDVVAKARALLGEYEIECVDAVTISNTKLTGFDELKSKLRQSLQQVERSGSDDSAMLPIDRVFSKAGYGVVITGTLVRGTLAVGNTIAIEPGGIKGRIRGLETFKTHVEQARAGQRLAVNIALKEHKSLIRGQVISTIALPVVQTLIVNLHQIGPRSEWIKEKDIADQAVRIYHGTAEGFGHLRWCESVTEAAEGQNLVAQIALHDPLVVEPGDKFVLRFGDEGITGGSVLMTARPRWLTRARLSELLKKLLANDLAGAALFYVQAASQIATHRPVIDSFVPPMHAVKVAETLQASPQLLQIGDNLIDKSRFAQLKERLSDVINNAAAGGATVSVESARVQLARGLERAVFQQAVKELTDSGAIVRDGDKLSVKQSESAATAAVSTLAADALALLEAELCLEVEELASRLGRDRKTVTAAITQLSQQKKAFIVNYDFAASEKSILNAHRALAKIWGAKREISPADFRDELGTTRKYALALLAYFDDNAVTRRMQNSRVLLKSPPAAE